MRRGLPEGGPQLTPEPRKAQRAAAKLVTAPGGATGKTPEAEATIVGVDMAVCAVAMPNPVRIGHAVFAEREYATLRIRTSSGVVGMALGHARNVPIMEMLERLAPALIGRDAIRRNEILGAIRAANVNGRGSLVRAIGLIDVALWDVLARSAGLPLWRLLGGSRSCVPLLGVAGYFSEIRSRQDIEDEVRALVASGYQALKVPIEGRDPRGDAKYVAQLQRAAGKSVAFGVDTHMAWNSLPEALESVRLLDDLGLAFIEDPFPPDRWRLTQELQERLQTPIAVGEDALHLDELRNLIEAATILRVDATASGGIGVVLEAIALATAAGRGLMTHSFPELHGQIAGGMAAVELVEMLPYDAGANPVGELLYRRQQVVDGQLVLDEEPGHGMFIDWDAVLKHARRVSTVGSSSS